jgi:hypothetical protein
LIDNGSHPITRARPNTGRPVKPDLTAKRRSRPVVENDTYAAFSRRVIAAHARRVATGDIEGLPDLTALYDDLDEAVHHAVIGLRACGYSWTEIATRLGITRQAAHQRWGLSS